MVVRLVCVESPASEMLRVTVALAGTSQSVALKFGEKETEAMLHVCDGRGQ